MGKRAEMFEAALRAMLTDRPLAYHPELARIGGGVQAGVFLSQLLYWTPRGKDEEGWIWKSKADWYEEAGLTKTEVDRARRELKERGLISENLTGVPATIHYRVNLDRLAKLLANGIEDTDEAPLPRDEKGRFVSESESPPKEKESTPEPSCRETGQLDGGKPDNWMAGNRTTRSPENGQLSIDYTENTPESTTKGEEPEPVATLPGASLEDFLEEDEGAQGEGDLAERGEFYQTIRFFPIGFQNGEFAEAWQDWLVYQRDTRGRGLPELTVISQSKMLKAYPPDKAAAMIRRSITNGWKGVFPLKEKRGTNKKTASRPKQPPTKTGPDGRTIYTGHIGGRY